MGAATITKPHVLVVPFPAQGHINPVLAFAKRLASEGINVTFIITTKLSKFAKISDCSSITIDYISDGSEEEVKEPETIEAYRNRIKAVFSANLAEFIQRSPAKLVIYDSTMSWVLDLAHDRGLLGAPFFIMSSAVVSIFYHLKQGSLKFPYEDSPVSLPALPTLQINDLPSLSHPFMRSSQTAFKMLVAQFLNLERADWIFINTFDMLEKEVVEWMASRWPIKTVGPTFLLQQKHDKFSNHTINLFEAKHDSYKEWLDSREIGSVVYVSFGSIASLDKEQMEELALGLIKSNCYFLWVVRSSEMDKLPENFNSEKGLIVEWCNQPEVLAHPALACFLTHCGWNSILEALSYGVPLIAMQQWVDQNTNAKFIQDVWSVGVGTGVGENGIIGREEIAMCIEQVVGGERSIELKRNACKFKKLANEAVEYGGTSANNIQDFVSKLMS
ncbi:hypothetical protein C2S53_003868 [Perilla frutescens var. hirtella]|uniref:anthocyanidin 3-O-glucoside 5-O-glucosyltransferase n=1 Tax=Perilla frutescens var. hirtella TaxID=608512 RepID=A0AAD4JJ77_PERFH|nr:hypothetical protein C2S53_003868 [Perilla frutescens var. hirtella]